jgi:pimeloyl-ACP methyl ester carboxylesterase
MAFPSILFIHGAANGAWVWDLWRRHLRPFGWEANVLDLRGHGRSLPIDFTTVTMESYVEDVESVAAQIAAQGRHPIVAGWSMGGLIALMYAAKHPETPALVLISPSPPAEVADPARSALRREQSAAPYGPEVYGLYPDDPQASREALHDLNDSEARRVIENVAGARESGVARHQRLRGISIPAESIVMPVHVIYGERENVENNEKLAAYYGAGALALPDVGHWGVVYHESAVIEAAMHLSSWLRRVLRP